jgi:hypothetical protein
MECRHRFSVVLPEIILQKLLVWFGLKWSQQNWLPHFELPSYAIAGSIQLDCRDSGAWP